MRGTSGTGGRPWFCAARRKTKEMATGECNGSVFRVLATRHLAYLGTWWMERMERIFFGCGFEGTWRVAKHMMPTTSCNSLYIESRHAADCGVHWPHLPRPFFRCNYLQLGTADLYGFVLWRFWRFFTRFLFQAWQWFVSRKERWRRACACRQL